MRLIATVLGTLALVLMAFGTVYFWGMGRIFPKYDHPFFTPARPWLAVPYSLRDKAPANAILWVDVARNEQGVLVISERPTELASKEVTKEARTSKIELIATLEKSPHRRWILNIIDNAEDIDRQLAKVLEPFQKTQDLAIQSDFDVVLRATKEAFADVPYGASQSDRMRFQSFEGMAPWSDGLLPATPYKGDIFITPLLWRSVKLIDPAVVNEIHRRQKYVLLGPLHSVEELNQAEKLAVDGYYITDPALWGQIPPAK